MAEFFATIKNQVTEFLARIDKKQKISLIVLFILIFAVSLTAALILGHVEYTTLYSGMEAAEAGEVMSLLKTMNVDVKTQGTGTILVPAVKADELRMELAAQGYPRTGLNYDLFASAAGFGSTDADRRTYLQYQLQENLRTTILRMEKISDCIVIINMATESSFVLSRDPAKATASVMLELARGQKLTHNEIKAIGALVSTSVPNLLPENVSIVDSAMNLYNATDEDDGSYETNQYQLKTQVQDKLAEQIDTLLSPVFGRDNIRTAVNVVLNFDSETVSTVEFSPPVEGETDGMILSIEEIYEASRDQAAEGGPVGSDANGLNTIGYVYQGLDDGQYYERVQRAINYELNQTTTMIEKAKGSIKDLSVAVLVDSSVAAEDVTGKVRSLVAKAIGVEDGMISVESMPFTAKETGGSGVFDEYKSILADEASRELVRTLIVAAAVVVVAILMFILLRTLFAGVSKRTLAGAYEGQNIDVIVGDDGEPLKAEEKPFEINREKSNTATQIEKFIEKDSEAVAQLLRNWLTDDR